MSYYLTNLLVLGLAGLVFWRLNEYDTSLSGVGETRYSLRRIIRYGVSLLLADIGYWGLWRFCHYDDRRAGFFYFLTFCALAFMWSGSVSELLANILHWFVDPQDNREYNPRKEQEELDRIGNLVRSGRKQEAIELCRKLKKTGDVSVAVLEMTLEHLGAPREYVQKPGPLHEADRLRREGKYPEAEAVLKSALRWNRSNTDAAFMLMRLYAENMKQQDKATEVLRSLEKQPHVSSAYIDFARRSIIEWQKPPPLKTPAEPAPQTLEELLAQRYYGTAVEVLELRVKEEPNHFDHWLRLIEVHSRYCANHHLAEKIIRRMEANPVFSAEQMDQAQSKLKEWKHKEPGT
jgi:tetratricopeptide (TPR) repeat protein